MIAKSKKFRWQKTKYSVLSRQIDIFLAAGKFMLYLWWDSIFPQDSLEHKKNRAVWLVNTLIDLGPTFIKIGQSLSTRADLLPLEYIEALGTLQDQVPAFSSQEAMTMIQLELGKPVQIIYKEFESNPLAAASLGQVHRAKLYTDEDVVVKIQRPGLEALFNLDFKILLQLIKFCNRYFVGVRKYNLNLIYDEFFNLLFQEIDYIQEGKNSDKFRENFQGHSHIIVPKVYWQYTTTKILTLEYKPGIKITDKAALQACGINITKVNERGISCYLKQLLQDGFFQVDPHPGNMAINPDGSIIFYDFGMMAEIGTLDKDQMIKTFFAILKKDSNEVVDTLISMGLIEPMPNMTPVKRLITFLLDKFTDKPLDVKALGEVKSELYEMFEQQPFRLPAQMIFILKALTTLDGIARTLDPQYNLTASAQPFVRSIAITKSKGNVIAELSKQTKDFLQYQLTKPNRTEVLVKKLEERVERGELQLIVKNVESDRILRRIYLAVKALIYACLTGFSLLAGLILMINKYNNWAIAVFCVCGFCLYLLVRSLTKLAVREKIEKMG
ncbi:AarF/ABC1/UbiB kinase family protein [Dolichospermum sp. ST_con]|nr:AarF/ABC1/UbiB kinase family protein [Dolichospermum sp. ST_con]MDD1418479.1 AarF/ABC1/UbiB kinase family protein [Dolichospermum sp. ST_sed1]MDD1424576.1 AarF/ABC1/UbiB kinase family protein [Dolichospermum sp. ST_sed9]MDD1432075.1 AarF/ABC1/UbiB kinase family protein [Dolichospermum sp. ST_sed6]MDD1435605.1 AarF/ABC1/UbiB kinase family protein [Dolichospermum sp. ST_sed10]MDD1441489.1 AarF/ABC1/UbiB kinase family protein [Dolichospermum sp. ST_sed3]MDD1447168.1 AarF/ABC1/UbiB kinase fami